MQIGCHLPTQGAVATREALITFARTAEDAHMASLWVSDHVVFPRMGNSNYPSGRFPHAPDTAYIDQYCAYKALGLSHLALDFRREDLSEMLDTLALVADEIRPAVQAG
jgi:hypothetical protein